MSEVDRLSNSGLYPALPIADRDQGRERGSQPHPDPDPEGAKADQQPPAPSSHIVDEYV